MPIRSAGEGSASVSFSYMLFAIVAKHRLSVPTGYNRRTGIGSYVVSVDAKMRSLPLPPRSGRSSNERRKRQIETYIKISVRSMKTCLRAVWSRFRPSVIGPPPPCAGWRMVRDTQNGAAGAKRRSLNTGPNPVVSGGWTVILTIPP